ncbi:MULTISPECIES: hypothetical protein [Serratia]|uniref:hypothetical protein n=1 Tax=Serratia TaxID=613 RepID=UPI001AEB6F50|nr:MULTISPECIES: hypothetical protein [Serratia]MBP1132297.1 hypothetical protein [Serratia sp. PL17]
MSLSRFQLQFQMENQAKKIRNSQNFHAAIVKHGELLKDTYKKHPLFYKIIFRNSRFIVCSTILSIYYLQSNASLKDIKKFFKGKNIISESSLDSFLFFLRVGRRLEIKPCDRDRRLMCYKPTLHALFETQALIASIALPYQMLTPKMPIVALLENPGFIPDFFAAYGQFMLKEIYLIDLVPQSELFISKDAGHMILLMLFIESIKQDSPLLLLSSAKIAKCCSVSRAHINRILKTAEKSGLLSTINNVVIELNRSFFIMAERYLSLYFSMIEFGLENVENNQYALKDK